MRSSHPLPILQLLRHRSMSIQYPCPAVVHREAANAISQDEASGSLHGLLEFDTGQPVDRRDRLECPFSERYDNLWRDQIDSGPEEPGCTIREPLWLHFCLETTVL